MKPSAIERGAAPHFRTRAFVILRPFLPCRPCTAGPFRVVVIMGAPAWQGPPGASSWALKKAPRPTLRPAHPPGGGGVVRVNRLLSQLNVPSSASIRSLGWRPHGDGGLNGDQTSSSEPMTRRQIGPPLWRVPCHRPRSPLVSPFPAVRADNNMRIARPFHLERPI